MPTMNYAEYLRAHRLVRKKVPIEEVMAAFGGRFTAANLNFEIEGWRDRFRVKRAQGRAEAAARAEVGDGDHARARAADDKFQAAMLHAGRSGTERVHVGVVTDDTPLVVRRIYRSSAGTGNSALADA